MKKGGQIGVGVLQADVWLLCDFMMKYANCRMFVGLQNGSSVQVSSVKLNELYSHHNMSVDIPSV